MKYPASHGMLLFWQNLPSDVGGVISNDGESAFLTLAPVAGLISTGGVGPIGMQTRNLRTPVVEISPAALIGTTVYQ